MVLVTGGTGLVGSHLLLRLLENETPVKAIYRTLGNLEKVKKVFAYYSDNSIELFSKIQWVQADLNDISGLEIAFESVTHVYHSAALISFDPRDYNALQKINVEGTANIVNFCIAKNIQKLCYVSSVATIGKSNLKGLATEEHEWNDYHANVYALSKWAAEMEVWRGAQENLSVFVLNPGIIVGPGFWDTGSGALFTISAANKNYFPPGGTGLISVSDVVKLMMRLMHSKITNERYIAVSEHYSYKAILEKIALYMGKTGPKRRLKGWELELLRRLDGLRCFFTNKRRKLTKQTVYSLKNPTTYSNQKIGTALVFDFEPIEEILAFCSRQFLKEHP